MVTSNGRCAAKGSQSKLPTTTDCNSSWRQRGGEAKRALERSHAVDEQARGQPPAPRIGGSQRLRRVGWGVAATIERLRGQRDAMRRQCLIEAKNAVASGIVVGNAAEEEQIGRVCVPRLQLFQHDIGELTRATAIVGNHRRRQRSRQVDVDAADIGGMAQLVEGIRVVHTGNEQELDLLGQQRFRRPSPRCRGCGAC